MNLDEHARKRIELIYKQCINAGINTLPIVKKDYNYEITVNDEKEKIKIQVYFGKKGVKTILQGNLDSRLYKTVNELILDEPKLNLSEGLIIEPEQYIGTDECGKGDFFGPLVIAAVYVNQDSIIELRNVGVRDSKELSDYQITRIADQIRNIIPGDKIEVVNINPAKYNQLYEKFNNLNKILNWAHSKAISNLLVNSNSIKVITDKFSKSDLNIMNDVKHAHVDFIQLHGAEKFIGVAAASIIARDTFNKWFIQKERIGLKLSKGSSIIVERNAKDLLSKLGEERFSEFAKLHFKTYKRIKKI
ncbi:MAG: ribonuclease HIII [Bacteroidota bacterium]